MFSRCAISLAMTVAVAGAASAAILIDPLTVSGRTGVGSPDDSVPPANLINNSGLSAALGAPGTTVAIPASYPTVNPAASYTWRLVATTALPTTNNPLTFNLNLDPGSGGSAQGYNLSGLHVWNYSELWDGAYYNDRGVQTTELQYSTDGGATYLSAGNITLPRASDSSSYTGDDVSFGPLTSVTNVRFYGGPNYGGNYIGMHEVRFIGDAVPEPATLALLGLAAPLLLGRRTKRS